MAKIFLVEDNEMNRDMLSRRLIRRSYEIALALDGKQGVDMALSESPDLILLDMSLPVLNGWDAARILKADPDTQKIPIIALTAHAMGGDREKALEAETPVMVTRGEIARTVQDEIEAIVRYILVLGRYLCRKN